jgi:hypothetical protein
LTVDALEGRGERADAFKPDLEAHLRDAVIGVAQQRCGPLEAAGEQVDAGRFAEGAPERSAEVRSGEAGRARHVRHVDALGIAGVRQIAGAQ